MARIELNIVALGDFTSVNAQIKALQTQIATLNKGVAGVGIGSQLTKDLNAAQAAFKSTMLSTGQFTAQTVKMASETEKFGQALVSGKLKLSDYFNIITRKSGQASAALAALTAEQVKLQNSVIMADPTKKGLFTVYTPTKINAVTDATRLATMQQNLYNLSLEASSKALINWGKNTQWAGRQLTVGLTMPMVMFGAVAVKSFKDTNTELTRLQRLYGVGLTAPTDTQIAEISTKVIDLGKKLASTMGTAQKDTAATAADFAAIGRTGDDLIGSTEQAMRLAKLGSIDAHTAFTGIMSLQNTFKVGSKDLAESVNFLTAIQKQTALNLTDITDALPRIGPIVKQLGGTYKDTAVMMLSMKEAGVPAAQAANAIKSAMASLISPTSAAKDMFAKFNINLDSISSSSGGNPVKMIQALQKSLEGIEPLARAQLIEKLFGKFQFARVTAMLDNLGKAGSQTQLGFKIAGASATQLSKLIDQEMRIATESTTAKWSRAIESFKATIYPVGQKFMEVGTLILKVVNKIGHAFSSLPGPVKTVLGVFAGLGAFAGPVIMLTGLLANFAGYLLKGFVNIRRLAMGGKGFKELLTPELIASQNAAQLFGTAIDGDVEAVNLLDEALKKLVVTLEGVSAAMTVGTGTAALSNAAAMATMGMGGAGKTSGLSRVHMTGPIQTLNYKEAIAAAEAGQITVNGQVVKLNETLVADINKLKIALEKGLISAEQAALMSFKVLSNDVMLGPQKANALLSRGGSMATQAYLNQHMIPGMLSPSAMIASQSGSAISGKGQMQLEQAYEKLTRQVMIHEKQYTEINAENIELTHKEVLDRLNVSLTKEAETGDLLAKEQLAVVQSMIASRDAATKMTINAGNAANARLLAANAGLTSFSTQRGGSDYRRNLNAQSGGSYTSLTETKKLLAWNQRIAREAGLADGVLYTKSFSQGVEKGAAELAAAEEKVLEQPAAVEAASANGITVAQAYTAGLERGLLKSGVKSSRIVKLNLEKMSQENIAIAEAEGLTLGEAFAKGEQIGMQGLKRSKGGTGAAMGISMAAMMGGSAIGSIGGGNNQAANVAGSVVSNVGMGAMMAMFMPTLTAALGGLAPVLAGIAALTLAFKGLSIWMEEIKRHNAEVAASFKASSDAITEFGGKMIDVKQAAYNFATGFNNTETMLSKIAQYVKDIQDMKPENPLKMTGELLKGANSQSEINSIIKDFSTAQVAAGMDPKLVKDMVTSLLQYADKTKYLSDAQRVAASSTKDMATATKDWLNQLLLADGVAGGSWSYSYKAFTGAQKNYADALLQTTNIMSDATTPAEVLRAKFAALETGSSNTALAVHALAAALTEVGQSQAADAVRQMGAALSNNMALIQEVLRLNANGIKTDVNPNQDVSAQASDYAEIIAKGEKAMQEKAGAARVKAASDAAAAAKKAYQSQVNAIKLQTDKTTGLTSVQKNALIQDKARVKELELQLNTMQQQTSELEKQRSFNLSQADLDNQIRMKTASGDFLGASLLRQQKVSNVQQYSGQQAQDEVQKQLTAAKESVAALEQIVADNKTKKTNDAAIASALSDYKGALKTLSAAQAANTPAAIGKSVADRLKELGITDTGVQRGDKPGHELYVIDMSKGGPAGSKDNPINAANIDYQTLAKASGNKVYDDKTGVLYKGFADSRKKLSELAGVGGGQYFKYPLSGASDPKSKNYGKAELYFVQPDGNVRDTGKKVPLAHGGQVRKYWQGSPGSVLGPGTSTSDSILAALSNGEYVTKAAAVSKYGTSFMDSVNSMTYNPNVANSQAIAAAATSGASNSSTYNINVTVNNEDANGIADTIMDRINRKEATVTTMRRLQV